MKIMKKKINVNVSKIFINSYLYCYKFLCLLLCSCKLVLRFPLQNVKYKCIIFY